MTVVGLLHPGAMGASIGAAARSRGHRVVWASEGRSDVSADRAAAVGLDDVSDLAALTTLSDVIISVCPPAAAGDVAAAVAATGFGGIFVDANAISPAMARGLATTLGDTGAIFVDGGIIGPPAGGAMATLLYLSGEPDPVERVATIFEGSSVEAVALDQPAGAASATKMAFAAWTKGSSALLLAVRALAQAEDVTEALDHAWERLAPDLPGRLAATAIGVAPKAWRFEAEMRGIATTFGDAGLPSGFHDAAAEVYSRLEGLRNVDAVTLPDVIDRLTTVTD